MDNERKGDNTILVILKKDKDKKLNEEELNKEISSLKITTLLKIREKLERYDSIFLDAQGKNIMYAIEIATADSINKLIDIKEDAKLKVITWFPPDKPTKQVRLPHLLIELVKKPTTMMFDSKPTP